MRMTGSANKNYLLAVLMLVLACNYIDRLVIGVVLQDIKVDLELTDTQLGFLSGIAFAMFYAVMGVPIARWADRGNRVTIIGLTTALWSAATALCGAVASFVQLLLVRIGVAVGEAGCYPSALSLISDYFDRAERPRAVARFMLGIPLALIVGYFATGWLNELYGWRTTFLVIGAPGIVLAIVATLTLKEPRRMRDSLPASDVSPPVREVFATLWANRAYRHLLLCFAIWGFFGQGILQWQPAFFVRSHELGTGELGTWLAVVYGGGGLLGAWLGGEMASRYAAGNERLQLLAVGWVYASLGLVTAGVYLAAAHQSAFGLLAVTAIAGAGANGPLFAATQTVVPPRMRAMSVAVMYFFCNLIGLGFGPLAVGALSDELRASFGEDSLRYALLAFCPGYFWCAWHLWRASRTVEAAIARLQGEGAAAAMAGKSSAGTLPSSREIDRVGVERVRARSHP